MPQAILDIAHGNKPEYQALGFKRWLSEPEFKYLFRDQNGTPENYMLALMALGKQKKFYPPFA